MGLAPNLNNNSFPISGLRKPPEKRGTPRVGVSTSAYGRDVRLGYSLGMLDRETLHVELGVDAQRRERPRQGGTSTGALGRATVRW